LTSTEVHTSAADVGVVTLWKRDDEVMDVCILTALMELLLGNLVWVDSK
jgi:hypothetical protein